MTPSFRFALYCLTAVTGLVAIGGATAQQLLPYTQTGAFQDATTTRRALAEARAQAETARLRGEKLEADAARATEAAQRTAQESAAVAARIQQAEAQIAAQEARIRLIGFQRRSVETRLAERQRPVVELTAALQRLSRRPPVLSLLRPASLRETMYTRAMLATLMPQVEQKTAALRAEIRQVQALHRQAMVAGEALRASEGELSVRRKALVELETRQRLASRAASGVADREEERALALAEEARDLDALMADLGRAATLRETLARLPGPVMRPARPQDAQVSIFPSEDESTSDLPDYRLPVDGRLVAGFGETGQGIVRSRGISIAARGGAQVVAPATGRIGFAGPYRGFGSIIIIEHGDGWTTLITGMAQLDVRVGDRLVAGSPLGTMGPGQPVLTLELRRDGMPVNPLDHGGRS